MEEERKVFTFLRSFYDAALQIPDKTVQADFLMAICSYSLDGTVPELTGYAAMAFALAKPNIDSNKKRSLKKSLPSNSEVTAKLLPSNSEVTPYNMSNELMNNENELRSNDKPPKSPKGRDADFEEFWSIYPKKVGKGSAKKAFAKVKEPLETLVSAVKRQECSSQWSKDNGQYIPNPATWLNQERWNDELDGVSAQKQNDAYSIDELQAIFERV